MFDIPSLPTIPRTIRTPPLSKGKRLDKIKVSHVENEDEIPILKNSYDSFDMKAFPELNRAIIIRFCFLQHPISLEEIHFKENLLKMVGNTRPLQTSILCSVSDNQYSDIEIIVGKQSNRSIQSRQKERHIFPQIKSSKTEEIILGSKLSRKFEEFSVISNCIVAPLARAIRLISIKDPHMSQFETSWLGAIIASQLVLHSVTETENLNENSSSQCIACSRDNSTWKIQLLRGVGIEKPVIDIYLPFSMPLVPNACFTPSNIANSILSPFLDHGDVYPRNHRHFEKVQDIFSKRQVICEKEQEHQSGFFIPRCEVKPFEDLKITLTVEERTIEDYDMVYEWLINSLIHLTLKGPSFKVNEIPSIDGVASVDPTFSEDKKYVSFEFNLFHCVTSLTKPSFGTLILPHDSTTHALERKFRNQYSNCIRWLIFHHWEGIITNRPRKLFPNRVFSPDNFDLCYPFSVLYSVVTNMSFTRSISAWNEEGESKKKKSRRSSWGYSTGGNTNSTQSRFVANNFNNYIKFECDSNISDRSAEKWQGEYVKLYGLLIKNMREKMTEIQNISTIQVMECMNNLYIKKGNNMTFNLRTNKW